MNFRDLTGQTFGRWTVLQRSPNRNRRVCWLCRCTCGNESIVRANNLLQGISTSCGCYQLDVVSTHHGTGTPEYSAWTAMKARCLYESSPSYQYYGGRGIRICPRWQESFPNFLADMGPKPALNYTLDRIDTNGDYAPDNCRWATPEEQSNNVRTNRLLTLDGKTQSVARWAKEFGLSKSALLYRLKAGYSLEQALATPSSRPQSPKRRSLTYQGKTQSIAAWAKEVGLSPGGIFHRLNNGWSVETALTTPSKYAPKL